MIIGDTLAPLLKTPDLRKIQRFVLSDDIAATARDISYDFSALLKVLPAVRLPYDEMWVEGRFNRGRPPIGFYVKSTGEKARSAEILLVHFMSDVSFNGTELVVDRNPDDLFRLDPFSFDLDGRFEDPVLKHFIEKEQKSGVFDSREKRLYFAALAETVAKHTTDPVNISRDRKSTIVNPMVFGFRTRSICSLYAFLALLNAKKGVDRQLIVRPEKRNAQLVKQGKLPALDYTVLRLTPPKYSKEKTEGSDSARRANRLHSVRGHFKLRKTGLYWWQPFVRGDATNPAARTHYEVR